MGKKKTLSEYIEQANKVHNNRYDYSKTIYNGDNEKICVICPEHGEFWINAGSHLKGYGCPEHSGLKKLDTNEFIRRSIETHGNKYSYEKSVYDGKRKKVTITCPIHGDFEQLPMNHIRGQGCPECGKKYAKEWRKGNYKDFINESVKRFGDIYDFPDIDKLYENSHSKIIIKCKKCGNIFEKIACDHLTSPHGGCLVCYANKSKGEEEISDFIRTIYDGEIQLRTRKVLDNNEIDIYLPELKIGIEYNGLYWHSEEKKDKNYHLLKLEECKSKGIRLIQIFEDEYLSRKEIVLSKIRHLIGKSDNFDKIYGRKCIIKEIDYHTSKDFLERNHIQGSTRSTIYIGAFNKDILIGVMSFKKEKNDGKWELDRFATDNYKICCGVGGKLFSYFVKKYKPFEIKSFADRRWTINEENNVYLKLGFKFEYYTYPDYKYFFKDSKKRYHKFNFRKSVLAKKYNLDNKMTESEMAKEINAYKVWDCGLIKYIWRNESRKQR